MGVSLAERFECPYRLWRRGLVFLKRELKSLSPGEKRREKALRLPEGKGRSGGNDAEYPDQLVWLVDFVERSGESPASHSREKFTQHFPCFVISQLWFLNHSDALENAVLIVYSYSLKSVGIKDFWWEWQRGPLRSCTPLACDTKRACCVNVVLCSFQGHLLFSG